MTQVLIVYATRTGETKKISELIAEGIRISGREAVIKSMAEIKTEQDLNGYDGYLFGSATYHGDMLPSMKKMLFLAEKADLNGKPGGSFGAFGWSGEAAERIFNTMKIIFKMDMVDNAFRLKSTHLEGAVQAAQNYGKDLCNKI